MCRRKIPAALDSALAKRVPYQVAIVPLEVAAQQHRIGKPAYSSARAFAVIFHLGLISQGILVMVCMFLSPAQDLFNPGNLPQPERAIDLRKTIAIARINVLKPLH